MKDVCPDPFIAIPARRGVCDLEHTSSKVALVANDNEASTIVQAVALVLASVDCPDEASNDGTIGIRALVPITIVTLMGDVCFRRWGRRWVGSWKRGW